EFRRCHDAGIASHETEEPSRSEVVVVAKRQRTEADRDRYQRSIRKYKPRTIDCANGAQERLVGQKLTRERLVVLGSDIERTSDISERRELNRVTDDRDAIFKVSE